MNTRIRMTKRQSEVLEMMRSGWTLCVRASHTRKGSHQASLVFQESPLALSRNVKVSFSIVDALQKAHLIRPVDSRCNQRIWIYDLVNNTSSKELVKNPDLEVDKIPNSTQELLNNSIDSLIISKQVESAEECLFDPQSIEDARERTLASIVRRRGQAIFRKKLLEIYQSRCAVTETNVEQILEAAHIIPYKGEKTNLPSNGLLLRADIHTLFDLGLIAIDTSKMTVLLSEKLACTDYSQFMGRLLRLPVNSSDYPSKEALDLHRKQSGL